MKEAYFTFHNLGGIKSYILNANNFEESMKLSQIKINKDIHSKER